MKHGEAEVSCFYAQMEARPTGRVLITRNATGYHVQIRHIRYEQQTFMKHVIPIEVIENEYRLEQAYDTYAEARRAAVAAAQNAIGRTVERMV